jgi:opacity protein-like surface antigen
MNHRLATAVIAVLAGSATLAHDAVAQNTAPVANPHPSTPALANPNANNPGAPATGSNSFTETQAKARIEAAGYFNVSGLVKDRDGIWRGKASKPTATPGSTTAGSTTVDVALDYQGNVVSR